MGHEGFYNFLITTMGSVISVILMYVLQVAWLCQRLIDQDYRQNHGSRTNAIADGTANSESVKIVTDFVFSRGQGNKFNSLRHTPRTKMLKLSKRQTDVPRRSAKFIKRRSFSRGKIQPCHLYLSSSQPDIEELSSLTTKIQCVNPLGTGPTLRKAFSDLNLSSSCSELQFFDNNRNYLSNGNIDCTTVTMTDQDFLNFIFTKSYVT